MSPPPLPVDDDDDNFFAKLAAKTPSKPPKRPRSNTNVESKAPTTNKKLKVPLGKENQAAMKPAALTATAKAVAKAEAAAAADAALDDDEVIATAGRPWSDTNRMALFTWLLGADGDEFFELHKKDPARVYKKVCLLFGDIHMFDTY